MTQLAEQFRRGEQTFVLCSLHFARGATVVLGVIYFVSAMGKGTNIEPTTNAIEAVLPFAAGFSSIVVMALVAVELALAAVLISGYRLLGGSVGSLVLSVVFLVWHFLVWLHPEAVDCGCGAPVMLQKLLNGSDSGLVLAAATFVLSVIAVGGFLLSRSSKKKDRSL